MSQTSPVKDRQFRGEYNEINQVDQYVRSDDRTLRDICFQRRGSMRNARKGYYDRASRSDEYESQCRVRPKTRRKNQLHSGTSQAASDNYFTKTQYPVARGWSLGCAVYFGRR